MRFVLSLQIAIARRRSARTLAAYNEARRNSAEAIAESALPEGQRPPFSGIAVLAALCVESDARSAHWRAADALSHLVALRNARSLRSAF